MSQELTLEQIQDFKGKYPKQLWLLFLTEMWERFCFYGMRGMLTVFMVTQLMINEKDANLQYGAIQAFIYAFTFIGGLFADKILGFRKSLFWGGLLMIAGSAIVAYNPVKYFYIGACFTIVGTGFFKPNISTMVGDLYKQGDPRRDAGFGLFYTGINLGALLGGIACVWIGKDYSWSLAFSFAGIVMIIGLITFIFTQRSLGPIGLSPLKDWAPGKRKMYEIATFIGSLACIPLLQIMVSKTEYTDYFMAIIGPAAFIYLLYEIINYTEGNQNKSIVLLYTIGLFLVTILVTLFLFKPTAIIILLVKMGVSNSFLDSVFTYTDKPIIIYPFLLLCSVYIFGGAKKFYNNVQNKLMAALIFSIFSILFWAFFEQSGGSLSLFALNNLHDTLLGGLIHVDPNASNNSSNSVFVIIFSWMIGLVWVWLAVRKKEPNSVVKFGLSFLFLSGGFFIFYATRFFADADGKTSQDVFTLAWLVLTLGELCLSPIGLSLMTKLAPKKLWGMMMGLWFLASAYGQYVAGILGAGISEGNDGATGMAKLLTYTDGYKQLAIYALIGGIILLVISPLIRKMMGDVK